MLLDPDLRLVTLTTPELQWLANTLSRTELGVHVNESDGVGWNALGELRRALLYEHVTVDEGEIPLPLPEWALFALDSHLCTRDLRAEKLPDGEPLRTLAEKIWRALLETNEEAGEEARDASDDYDPPDPDQALADAEALLRSGEGPRAG